MDEQHSIPLTIAQTLIRTLKGEAMKHNEDFVDNLKNEFRKAIYRGPDNQLPSVIYDTISILYAKSPLKPFIHKRTLLSTIEKTKPKITKQKIITKVKSLTIQDVVYWATVRPKLRQTWLLVIHLPPGVSYEDFKAKESFFRTAVGGTATIERNGEAVYMTISNIKLPSKYIYDFDPILYLKKMAIPIYLGKTADGPIVEDFTKVVSLFIAGLRDTGKTVLTHQAIYTCLNIDRIMGGNYIKVAIIDPKLKELRYFEDYGATWTHEPEENLQLLLGIQEANRLRKNIIGTKANNILEYNSIAKEPLPYIMLFVDEVDMVGADKDCANILIESVQKYRSQGIYLLASTQRPDADTFKSFSKFKSQFEARMCYRMADEINSRIVIGSGSAAHLPIIPGRAIYKYDREVEIQTPYFPSRIWDPKPFNQLMDQLPKVALPYHDIEGEVIDHEPFYPRPRKEARSKSIGSSRSLKMLISGANPFN